MIKRYVPELVVAALAVAIAWLFAATTLRAVGTMGFPLDDSYIYLTYAKQFGRGEPFSYYPGGGYSAGSTSVLWPMLLAPFWTLGARGHALVWVSFVTCAGLYAASAVAAVRLARRIVEDEAIAGLAGVAALAIPAFAWTSLSGMEVAFASALLVAMIVLLVRADRSGAPGKALIACLAAASLSRPELTMIVGLVAVVCAWQRRKTPKVAAMWALPLIAPLAWVIANKIFAGHLFPNTGVVKSHFYQPGFELSSWPAAVGTQLGKVAKSFLWSWSPIPTGPLFMIAWAAGAVRVVLWARRTGHRLAAVLLVGGPWVLIASVVATSAGTWDFQNYRYVAPGFPLLAIVAAVGIAPPMVVPRVARWVGAGVVAVVLAVVAAAPMRSDTLLFAQGANDTNTQVVAIGRYIDAKLPDAHVMFHDAGAIAYYGDGDVFDMLGLVTNHQAGVANNGPGSRFEFLESLPEDKRPTHFAYYPPWLTGTNDFYGEVLLQTPLKPELAKDRPRLAGGADMQIIVANWDHVGTGERPLFPPMPDGWEMTDRFDTADLASEAAHGYRGALGAHEFGDHTAKWSFLEREVRGAGLVIDGGRTIRGGEERFEMRVDPARPVRLVLRTGGAKKPPFQDVITTPVEIEVFDGDRKIGSATLPKPDDAFVEVPFEVASHGEVLEVRTAAKGMYRSFHWFALQPRG